MITMKKLLFLVVLFLYNGASKGQYPLKMRNLWTRPQVHIIFGDYRVSFAIRDINKALRLIREQGDTLQPKKFWLDTAGNYTWELYSGTRMQYNSPEQAFIQNVVGAYLLSSGMALVENRKLKRLEEIVVDVRYTALGGDELFVDFFDPKTNQMLFSGKMPAAIYKMDMGIDD